MSAVAWLPPLLGLVGLGCAYYIYTLVLRYPEGDEKIKKIGDQIHLGAMVFMKSEYRILAVFAAILFGAYAVLRAPEPRVEAAVR